MELGAIDGPAPSSSLESASSSTSSSLECLVAALSTSSALDIRRVVSGVACPPSPHPREGVKNSFAKIPTPEIMMTLDARAGMNAAPMARRAARAARARPSPRAKTRAPAQRAGACRLHRRHGRCLRRRCPAPGPRMNHRSRVSRRCWACRAPRHLPDPVPRVHSRRRYPRTRTPRLLLPRHCPRRWRRGRASTASARRPRRGFGVRDVNHAWRRRLLPSRAPRLR